MKGKEKAKESQASASAPKMVLEDVIGLTTRSASGLASNTASGKCVYIAGCVAIVYNVGQNTRSPLVVTSRQPKPLSCVALSRHGGAFVAVGESGSQPAVLVWDSTTRILAAELKGHRHGVSCIDFSPNGEHLVSVGFPHDGYIFLWDWQSGHLMTKLKASTSNSPISSISFSSDKNHFITTGKKHLKFWTLRLSTRFRSNAKTCLLDGKPADLCSLKASCFIAVTSISPDPNLVCGGRAIDASLVFALTDEGTLCLLQFGGSVRKCIKLEVSKSFALATTYKLIACACSNGIVQLVGVETLGIVGSLQYKKNEDQLCPDRFPPEKSCAPIPDAVACQFSTSEKLVVVYADHSLYVWDVASMSKVIQTCALVSHSACIWDVKNIPCKQRNDPPLASVAKENCCCFSFATCSEDKTVRLWDLLVTSTSGEVNAKSTDLNNQPPCCSLDSQGALCLVRSAVFEPDIDSSVHVQGFHSLATSSDRRYLAVGDSQGNIHVYNLCTYDYTCFQEAHAGEVLSLDFFPPEESLGHSVEGEERHYLLASGGRDGMIHIYDVKRGLSIIKSLDDHSAAITSVKFTSSGSKILSCSADRSILFCDVATINGEFQILQYHHDQTRCDGVIYDMAVNPVTDLAVTVGQDKKMNMFDVSTGKFMGEMEQNGNFGEPIKVVFDQSGSFVACSYSNKCIVIYDFASGELLTQALGHAEVITGIIFLPDYKHMISVSGDSCIFIWRLPSQLSSEILQKTADHAASARSLASIGEMQNGIIPEEKFPDEQTSKTMSGFKFSLSKLPKWAQTKLTDISDGDDNPMSTLLETLEPKSDASGISELDEETPRLNHERQWNTIHYIYLDQLETPKQLVEDVVNAKLDGDMRKYEGADLFNQHFNNLSAVPKLDGSRKSSKRRSLSSRFILHHNCLTNSNVFFGSIDSSGNGDVGVTNEADPPNLSGRPPTTHNEDETARRRITNHKTSYRANGVPEEINGFRAALIKLDTAAQEILQSVIRLNGSEGNSEALYRHVDELRELALEWVPSIKRKVDALNDLTCKRTKSLSQ